MSILVSPGRSGAVTFDDSPLKDSQNDGSTAPVSGGALSGTPVTPGVYGGPRKLDNAACEDFFGRLKKEMFYNRNWRHTTVEQFVQLVDSYIRWYNEKRLKLSLGGLSPVEFRASRRLAA